MISQFVRVGDVLISAANVVCVYPYAKRRDDGSYKGGIEILTKDGHREKLLIGEAAASEELAYDDVSTLISKAESVK